MGISFLRKIFGGSAEKLANETAPAVEAEQKVPQPKLNAEDFAALDKETKDSSVSLEHLESFVLYVVKALVDEPDQVSLQTVEKNRVNVIQVRCVKKDIGKIIGKSGKTISAIRALVSGAAGKTGQRVTVDVLD